MLENGEHERESNKGEGGGWGVGLDKESVVDQKLDMVV